MSAERLQPYVTATVFFCIGFALVTIWVAA